MPDQREERLANALRLHGYGLQYSVLRELERAHVEEQLPWVFEVSEFPVTIQDHNTHIDFVVRHTEKPLYVIAECKRANPALSDWCFLKAPYTYRDHRHEGIIVDRLSWDERRSLRPVEPVELAYTADAYHIAIELKTDSTGDPCGRGRGELDKAASQVMIGVSGLIESFARSKVPASSERYLIPIVVTTASLWASDFDLGAADLESGNFDRDHVGLLPKAWVAYQFPTSERLKHVTARRFPLHPELAVTLAGEYIRTVQFVTPRQLPALLRFISDASIA